MSTPEDRKAAEKQRAQFAAYGDAIIAYCEGNGCPLMVIFDERNEAKLHQYGNGIWREIENVDPLIAMAAEGNADMPERTFKAINHYIKMRPTIAQRDVQFDCHGMVACANGLLDPGTGQLRDYQPEDYATRKSDVDYVPGASSPLFDSFLAGCLEDRDDTERKEITELLQEWFGAGLALHLLSREGRKALILAGPSRTGKTELSNIFRKLVGGLSGSPSVEELSDKFGMQSLYGVQSWVRDDAINEGDRLDPQKFKVVVTGEITSVNRKNRDPIQHSFCIPVFLTTNSLPDAKDGSDAIFNRSIVVEFTRVVAEEDAARLRKLIKIPPGIMLSDFIFRKEAPGILNWAIMGLDRLLQRGYFDLPERIKNSIQGFKDKNNPVGEWARAAIEYDPHCKILRADLMCSFHGWQMEAHGGGAKAMGGQRFFGSFRDAAPKAEEITIHGKRYFAGVRLNKLGLEWWKQHNKEGAQLSGGSRGAALDEVGVNQHRDHTASVF
jgi:P4 family phage/plasmid primase-like protien